MNKRYAILLLFIGLFPAILLGQNFHWAKTFGSPLNENCHHAVFDKYGNSYLAGEFGYYFYPTEDSIQYGYSTPYLFIEDDTLFNNGFDNIFLIKYDKYGYLVWAKSIGGDNYPGISEIAGGLVSDTLNNFLYLAGNCEGWVSLGCDTPHTANTNIFLTKLDLDGSCIWTKYSTGYGNDVRNMCNDHSGNLYITGISKGSMSIQSFSFEKGGYVAKFDPDGNCIWAKREFIPTGYSADDVIPESINVIDSDIVVGGMAQKNHIIIDSVSFTENIFFYQNTSYPGLIVRFDGSGKLKWGKFIGSPYCEVTAVDHDGSGNIYACGWFYNTCWFDSVSYTSYLGDGSMFLAKCDPSGKIIRLDTVGITHGASADDMKIDKSGNCFITGTFRGTANFGQSLHTSLGSTDVFMAEYYPNGNTGLFMQIKINDEGNQGTGYAIGITNDGSSILTAGGFNQMVIPGTSTTITASGDKGLNDIFIVKYDLSSGIENKKDSNSLIIYSNPNSGAFTIKVPYDMNREKSLIVSVYDQIGNLVFQKNMEVNQDLIGVKLETASQGLYVVSVGNGYKYSYGKIIVD
jgi:hypothetical protein